MNRNNSPYRQRARKAAKWKRFLKLVCAPISRCYYPRELFENLITVEPIGCYFCETPLDTRGACQDEACDYKGIVPCPGCGTVQVWHHGYSCDKREEFYQLNPLLTLEK